MRGGYNIRPTSALLMLQPHDNHIELSRSDLENLAMKLQERMEAQDKDLKVAFTIFFTLLNTTRELTNSHIHGTS